VEEVDTQLIPAVLQPMAGAMAHMQLVEKVRFPIPVAGAGEQGAVLVKIVQVAMAVPVSSSFVTHKI
jgi:hypothetical protein